MVSILPIWSLILSLQSNYYFLCLTDGENSILKC